MSIDIIESKLKSIILEYIDVDESAITSQTNLVCDMGVDSFSLISMMSSIEEEFNIHIPDGALVDFRTVSDVVNYINTAVA